MVSILNGVRLLSIGGDLFTAIQVEEKPALPCCRIIHLFKPPSQKIDFRAVRANLLCASRSEFHGKALLQPDTSLKQDESLTLPLHLL